VRRHGERDLLRHRRRREIGRVRELRLRGVEGAAAAGGGEEAEERGGPRAPAEHRAGLFVLLLQSLLWEEWAGPGGVLMRFI